MPKSTIIRVHRKTEKVRSWKRTINEEKGIHAQEEVMNQGNGSEGKRAGEGNRCLLFW